MARFALDYTFYLNTAFVVVAIFLVGLYGRYTRRNERGAEHQGRSSIGAKRIVAMLALMIVVGGLVVSLVTGR